MGNLNTALLVINIIVGLVILGTVLIKVGAAIQWQKDHDELDAVRFEAQSQRLDRIERVRVGAHR